MREVLDILFGVSGPEIWFEPREGRPSAIVSSEIFANTDGDDGTEESSARSGSAAVDTNPNTTIDASSGDGQADPTTLNVAATTGFVLGRTYRVTNAAGEFEDFECIEITSGASVRGRHEFRNAYESADAVVTTRVTQALDTTWTADSTKLSSTLDPNPRWRWRCVYTVDGVDYATARWFDLVRYRGEHSVIGLDVDAAWPGWLRTLTEEHREDAGARLIKEAYRAVKMHLHREKKADQMARNGEVVDDLVCYMAAVIGERAKLLVGEGSEDSLAVAQELYEQQFDGMIRGATKLPFAHDSGGGAKETKPLGISRR